MIMMTEMMMIMGTRWFEMCKALVTYIPGFRAPSCC